MSSHRIQKSKPSAHSTSSTIHPAKVPRPMNCFLLYRQDKQKEILEKCPGANHRDISKIISKWWKEATPHEKEPYMKKAALAKVEHARRYPTYKYMPQKKSKNGTRTYKRRTQDEFTSKSKKLNDFMKQIYYNGDSSALSRLSAPLSSSVGDQMSIHADSNSASSPMPTISVDSVPCSLSLSPMNSNRHSPCLLNMSSPSSSSLSLSLSSTSSPSYNPYHYSDSDVYHPLTHETMMDPAFFLMNGQHDFYTSPLIDQGTALSVDSSSTIMSMDIPHPLQSIGFGMNDTMYSAPSPPLDNLCVASQYYLQHSQFDALVNGTLSPSSSVYSKFGGDGYDYSTQQCQYNQRDQQLGQECSLSSSDFSMYPSSPFYTLSHPDLYHSNAVPDSLL